MAENSGTVLVTLDAELRRAAEQCAADCGFADVQELILFLLRGALQVEDKAMDEQELALVQKRLQDLGYLE